MKTPPIQSRDVVQQGMPTDSAPATLISNLPNGRHFILTLFLVGVAGAFVGAMLMGPAIQYFKVPPYPLELQAKVSKVNPYESHPQEIVSLVDAHQSRTTMLNTSLAFAALSATTIPFLGLAAGLAFGSWKNATRGLIVGLLAGTLLGAIAGATSVFLESRLQAATSWDPMIPFAIAHASAWIIFSIGMVMTIVSATLKWHRLWGTVLTAGVTSVISAVIFQPLAMVITPLEQMDTIVPIGGTARALFACLSVGLIGLAIARSQVTADQKKHPTAASPTLS